jgi:hypothetical protein
LALMAALLLSETAVLATTVVKTGGPVMAVSAVRSGADEIKSTTSTAPVDIPGMSLQVSVPSNELGLFVIQFSAESLCDHSSVRYYTCYVRVLVDGIAVRPSPIAFDTTENFFADAFEAHSTQWVFGPVGSGTHTVRMQFWVSSAAMYFPTQHSTLVVLRSKG